MAIYKVTTLMQYSSGVSSPTAPIHRTAGFSESWYSSSANASAVVALFSGVGGIAGLPGYWPSRAALLPLGTSIVGFRLQQVSPLGPSQAGVLSYPGTSGYEADTPQQALLCRCAALGMNNIRRFTLRCLPDTMITEGEGSLTFAFQQALQTLATAIGFLYFRGRDLGQPSFRIVNISAVGQLATVTTEVPVTFPVNSMVRILRTVDSGKNLRGGRFQTASGAAGSITFTLNNWPFGSTTGGSCRQDGIVYPQVDSSQILFGRVVQRRVGRPFVGYRGRRSKRR